MSKSRKVYDREFKLNAVRLIQSEEGTVKEIAEDLGVNYYTLYEWKRDYEKNGESAFPGNGKKVYASEAEKEISELKKKVRKLEMERDILKKAMTISLRDK
jgi:transposase